MVIEAVYTHRVLNSDQIYDLLFARGRTGGPRKSKTRCRHRLKMLYHHGYLERLEQPTIRAENKPYLYLIGRRSIPILAARMGVSKNEIEWKPKHNQLKDQSIKHLVTGNDIRVALEIAARRFSIEITDWIDDLTMRSRREFLPELDIESSDFGIKRVRKIPDGYFRLRLGDKTKDHFLEIDMGTEPMRAIKEKAKWYLAYYRYGWIEDEDGPDRDKLVILFVTTGPRRMANIKKVFEDLGAGDRFRFTTFDEATPRAILTKPIWAVAGDKVKRNFFHREN